jgi:hypothetical protein
MAQQRQTTAATKAMGFFLLWNARRRRPFTTNVTFF